MATQSAAQARQRNIQQQLAEEQLREAKRLYQQQLGPQLRDWALPDHTGDPWQKIIALASGLPAPLAPPGVPPGIAPTLFPGGLSPRLQSRLFQQAEEAQREQEQYLANLSAEYQRQIDENRINQENRYADIGQGLYDTRSRVLADLAGFGQSQIDDANQRYDQMYEARLGDLTDRGLRSSSGVGAEQRANEAERGRALNRINDDIIARRTSADRQLSGDLYGFMERRSDVPPTLSELIQLQGNLGRVGGPTSFGGRFTNPGLPGGRVPGNRFQGAVTNPGLPSGVAPGNRFQPAVTLGPGSIGGPQPTGNAFQPAVTYSNQPWRPGGGSGFNFQPLSGLSGGATGGRGVITKYGRALLPGTQRSLYNYAADQRAYNAAQATTRPAPQAQQQATSRPAPMMFPPLMGSAIGYQMPRLPAPGSLSYGMGGGRVPLWQRDPSFRARLNRMDLYPG